MKLYVVNILHISGESEILGIFDSLERAKTCKRKTFLFDNDYSKIEISEHIINETQGGINCD